MFKTATTYRLEIRRPLVWTVDRVPSTETRNPPRPLPAPRVVTSRLETAREPRDVQGSNQRSLPLAA